MTLLGAWSDAVACSARLTAVSRYLFFCSLLVPRFSWLALDMQTSGTSEPIVRIRDLKKNSVNFVLQNVDLAFVLASATPAQLSLTVRFM